MRSFITSFLIGIVVFSVILFGGEQIYRVVEGKSENQGIQSEEIEGEVEEATGEFIGLLIGVDGSELNSKEEETFRTDTIILGKVNFDTGKIDMLSIPRDTRVSINGYMDKINHAYAYGEEELTIKTIEEFLDIEIDHYVKVDFEVVQQMIDIIGGIELDVPNRMYYSDPYATPPLLIDLQPGIQTLDGKQAHDFLRFRSYPDGDIGRVKNQQYFMKEFIKQTLKPSNLLKIDKLVKAYYDNIDTDLTLKETLKYAWSAKKLDTNNIHTEMIPGTDDVIDGISYWIYDPVATDQMAQEMFRGGSKELHTEDM